MSHNWPGRTGLFKIVFAALLFCLVLIISLAFRTHVAADPMCAAYSEQVSDHFDGKLFYNPWFKSPPGEVPQKRTFWWVWRFISGPKWNETKNSAPGHAPPIRVSRGPVITPVGHGTFLIQMDGFNILTDPIWSKRCSPVSWAGPKRHQSPGIRFEDLPPIDAVLVSHNHYDHLDVPTLERLAKRGVQRTVTTLGNRNIISGTGIPVVDELDWWQSVRLSGNVTVTVVPAQHFSSRSLWDRNKTLWGGFVVSGPSGNVYYSGDTGYGPHFREISSRFSPINAALIPISPYWPENSIERPSRNFSKIHMGPADAVQAHLDLGAQISIAAHFQVFQLGVDGYDDAPSELKSVLAKRVINPDSFITPLPGQRIDLDAGFKLVNLPDAAVGF